MKDNKASKTKNNSKKIKKCIDCYEQPIYVPTKLYVVKGCTKKDIDKSLKWFDDGTSIVDNQPPYDGLTCFPVKYKDEETYSVVVILDDSLFENNIADQMSTIAHEAMHVAQDILENCGTTLSKETSEPYAFLVGWATKCIYTTLVKK